MDSRIEMLARARHDDLERRAARRRKDRPLATCRRRLLGFIPVGRACAPGDAAA
jgi:hypothetical protein